MRYQKYFYLAWPTHDSDKLHHITIPSQITFSLKLNYLYLVHIVWTHLLWPKFDLGTRFFLKVKTLHTVFVWDLYIVVMKIMKLELLEINQKALHINDLLRWRLMASKPNEVAHEHNHGILCLNAVKFDTYVYHALPMNVYIGSTKISLV